MNPDIRFQPFQEMTALIRAFSQFQDEIRESVQASVSQLQKGLEQAAGQFTGGLAEYERYFDKEEAEVFEILARGGWVGMERHLTMMNARLLLQVHTNYGEAEMNTAIGTFFNANGAARLEGMIENWTTIPYFVKRQTILRDAMLAHRAGQFTLSIPTLLPLAEGLSAELLGNPTTRAVQAVAEDWHLRETEAAVQAFHDVVLDLIYKFYAFGKDPTPYLNRHGILHGRDADYPSELNSTRVLLLIDTIAALWHARQSSLSAA